MRWAGYFDYIRPRLVLLIVFRHSPKLFLEKKLPRQNGNALKLRFCLLAAHVSSRFEHLIF
jgi:hypothetical protein